MGLEKQRFGGRRESILGSMKGRYTVVAPLKFTYWNILDYWDFKKLCHEEDPGEGREHLSI